MGRSRLPTVRRDFFLPADERLTEQERALMTQMLHGLVRDVLEEIRAALPMGAAANDGEQPQLVDRLADAGLLDDPPLVETLLRRATEEQVAGAIRARSGRREGRFLQTLVSDDDAGISAAAMGLILARGRRRDRFGNVRLELDDLTSPVAARLVYAVAAGLRHTKTPALDDRALERAATALLDRHDAARSPDRQLDDLVLMLDSGGRLGEELVAAAADEGEVALVAKALARWTAIPDEAAADLLLGGRGEGLALLLRMAAVSRDFAARLLAGPGTFLGVADAAEEITRFETLDQSTVDAAREWRQLHPAYRGGLEALGEPNGDGTL